MENKLIFLEMAEFQFGTFRIILIQEDDRYYVTTGIGSWNDYTFSLKWCYTFTEYEEAKKCKQLLGAIDELIDYQIQKES